ncbi:MAG TPA: hypothetical protein VGM44_15095 [Polyangiaceae bacterium]|jgi:hypothetical protein
MGSARRNLGAWLIVIAAASALTFCRSELGAQFSRLKIRNDVYTLPPPSRVVTMSLGYRSALADLIFAHVLVSSGIHFQEKRPFEFAANYLDAINAIDPKFEAPYRYADTLVTLQAKRVNEDGFRAARRILERGLAQFPFDQELWTQAGQFFAYLGPSAFSNAKEQEEWRLAGGRTLAHACELVGNNEDLPHQCVVAAGILTKAGEVAASRQFLERMKIVSDDPELLAFINAQLEKISAADPDHFQDFLREWHADLPFISRAEESIVGPNWDPAACAARAMNCPTSFRNWEKADNRTPPTTFDSSGQTGPNR